MTRFLTAHGRSIWLALLLVSLGGVIAAMRLPVSLFPNIDFPQVIVSVEAGDRDASQMAAQITRPIEIALREDQAAALPVRPVSPAWRQQYHPPN